MAQFFQLSLFRALTRWFPASRQSRRRRPRGSDGELLMLWRALHSQYFPEAAEVDQYTVCWSTRRQRRVLASCHIEQREVHVAKELSTPAYQRWLAPVLYHEMCHAVLGAGVSRKRGKRAWHGKEFKTLVRRHPLTHELETWIKNGGWTSAVRSDRARAAAAQRRRRAAA